MSRANRDPSKHTRIGTQIGLVFQDQRTGDFRRIVYVDSRVVVIRDEDGNTTLTNRDSFEQYLGTRYRPRPDADVDIDTGQYDRLRDRLTVYEHRDGRKAKHKADALTEALDLVAGGLDSLYDGFASELPDDVGSAAADAGDGDDAARDGSTGAPAAGPEEVSFEEIAGIGSDTAGNLRASGYVTEREVRSASDDDLLAVAGVGPANLANVREFLD